ncbi:MAG: hypothetical protein AAF557_18950 [Pseudomonadota bacterium]
MTTSMRFACAFVLLASIASAQTPAIYEFCGGAIVRMTPVDGPERILRLDVESGEDWVKYGQIVLDTEGRRKSLEIDGRGETIFEPHNCEKTVGICQYVETDPQGISIKKARINGRDGEEWSYSIMEDHGKGFELSVVGKVTYADDGLAQDESWTSVSSYTQDGCAKRIVQ